MKKYLPALLTGALLGGALAGRAQTTVSFGPRLGANLTTFSYSGNSTGLDDTKYQAGVQVGATLNLSFGRVAFQPSVLFSQKGAELRGSYRDNSGGYATTATATLKPRLNYIELPLNVVYTAAGDHGFQLFAGPYLALGVGGGGSYNVSLNSSNPAYALYNGEYPGSLTVEYGDRERDNNSTTGGSTGSLFGPPTITYTARRFDAGLNAGVGYRVGPVQAQLGYGLGLVNFVPKDSNGDDTGSKGYHRGFQLAATYFFATR